MNKVYLFAIACGLVLFGCARPCPKDIKEGSVNYSESTSSLIAAIDEGTSLRFENQSGKTKVLNLKYPNIHGFTKIPLEVLCQRGEFLDQSSQIRYLEAPTFYMTFSSADETVEIYFQAHIINDASDLNGDTLLYESFAVWIQDINISAAGSLTYLSNDRGNSVDFSEYANSFKDGYAFVEDTTISGHHLKDVYYNLDHSSDIRMFYSKEEGVVCFQTAFDTWILKMN